MKHVTREVEEDRVSRGDRPAENFSRSRCHRMSSIALDLDK